MASTTEQKSTPETNQKSKAEQFNEEKQRKSRNLTQDDPKDSFAPLSVTLYLLYLGYVLYRASQAFTELRAQESLLYVVALAVIGTLLGILVADFFSGIVHWAADTWGTLEWKMVGKTFIRHFRLHHVDPQAMTKYNWIYTNGDTCLLSIGFLSVHHVVLLCYPWLPLLSRLSNAAPLFIYAVFASFTLLLAMTNQFHKWSHMHELPPMVSTLQKWGIILNRQNHNVHHKYPFNEHYCITTGWCNPLFRTIRFWRFLEFVVTAVTGWEPREDDQVWNSHNKLLFATVDKNQ